MCTTRSDMDLASLFSSIILSKPNALAEPFMPIDRFLELTEEDDEWLEPSNDASEPGEGILAFVLLGSRCSTGHAVSFCVVFFAGAT